MRRATPAGGGLFSRAIPLCLALALLALGSCSKTSPEQPPVPPGYYGSSGAVCSLVKPQELEAISGFEYNNGVGEINPGFLKTPGITTCMWLRKGCRRNCDALGSPDKTYLGVIYAYARDIFRFQDSILRRKGKEVVKTVKGIGDDATWHDTVSELAVLRGNKIVYIQSNSFRGVSQFTPLQDRLTRSRRLAEIVLNRLR